MHILTSHPIAVGSVDHQHPHGTMRDNSRNMEFVRKMRAARRDIRVLDLGCSGGGMVKDFLKAGSLAVGVEGSDFSRVNGRANWPELDGRNLFTADATKAFQIIGDDGTQQFDLVTMWEFLEHIAEDDLPALFRNINGHLDPRGPGWLALSIATIPDPWQGHEYHPTVHPASWWFPKLAEFGFDIDFPMTASVAPDWVRGPLTGETKSVCAMLRRRD